MSRRLPTAAKSLALRSACAGMCGVTLVSPGYESLAFAAVRRFRKFTGMDTIILWTQEEPAFLQKLSLPDLVGARPVVFYDADWWAQAPLPLERWKGSSAFVGVADPGAKCAAEFPGKDCTRWGLNADAYLNTGFFICDLSNAQHRSVFRLARELAERHAAGQLQGVDDHGEQSWLNVALQLMGVTVETLPLEYNYFTLLTERHLAARPARVLGLHGAGIPTECKLAKLLEQEGTHGSI